MNHAGPYEPRPPMPSNYESGRIKTMQTVNFFIACLLYQKTATEEPYFF